MRVTQGTFSFLPDLTDEDQFQSQAIAEELDRSVELGHRETRVMRSHKPGHDSHWGSGERLVNRRADDGHPRITPE